MITRIVIDDFKSYRDAELPLAPLTLLIGANASGKSNAIEAMRFLSLLAQGRRLDDVFASVQRGGVAIRGTAGDLPRDGAAHFTLGCSLQDPTADEWQHFKIRLRIETANKEMRVVEEHIRSDHSTVPLYEIKYPAEGYSHEVQVAYNNFARGGVKPQIPCTDQQAIFTQLDTPSRFGSGQAQAKIPAITYVYRETLSGILFLDPSPRLMRGYSYGGDDELASDGSNLSGVLYNLCEKQRRKHEVLPFIAHLPEELVKDILFVSTSRGDAMIRLIESFGDRERERDAPLLSDGTLRVLSVAAALLSAEKGSLVIIEEIDNGVHPNRAASLLQNIRETAERRGLRVLLTSHNPALLDKLPDEAVPDVVACYRDPDDGFSRLVRLEDLHRYPALVARGPLGQLMTEGVLERFLKDRRSSAEAQQQTRSWLERFKTTTEELEF